MKRRLSIALAGILVAVVVVIIVVGQEDDGSTELTTIRGVIGSEKPEGSRSDTATFGCLQDPQTATVGGVAEFAIMTIDTGGHQCFPDHVTTGRRFPAATLAL
jgi:hypothetical protein